MSTCPVCGDDLWIVTCGEWTVAACVSCDGGAVDAMLDNREAAKGGPWIAEGWTHPNSCDHEDDAAYCVLLAGHSGPHAYANADGEPTFL